MWIISMRRLRANAGEFPVDDNRATKTTGRQRILLVLTGLYIAQAIPTSLFMTAIPPIFRQEGVSRTALGYLSLLLIPGVLKFLWAPMVDRFRPAARAHRAGWIVLTQFGVVWAILGLLLIEPGNIVGFLPIGLAVAVLISTQDIAADGFATLRLSPDERPLGNAIQSGAAALGVVLGGSVSLLLYRQFGWTGMIAGMAVFCLLPLIAVPFMREDSDASARASQPRPSIAAFLRRTEARHVLWVALVFRASEGLVKPMEAPYLVDAGVGLDAIAYLSGTGAAFAGVIGTVLIAWLLKLRGMAFVLVLLASIRVVCTIAFALHASGFIAGHSLLFGVALLQTFIRYTELVALFSLFMSVSSRRQPGTDFTILACAQFAAYLVGSIVSGHIADVFGYAVLFGAAVPLSALVVAIILWLFASPGWPQSQAKDFQSNL
jgi:PAT family beta-lactamase induction signal transducer AmpG